MITKYWMAAGFLRISLGTDPLALKAAVCEAFQCRKLQLSKNKMATILTSEDKPHFYTRGFCSEELCTMCFYHYSKLSLMGL